MVKPRNKYNAKKTVYSGKSFDSRKEAEYCRQLEILKKAIDKKDRVMSYKTQVPFQITINGQKICKYIADFVVEYADKHTEIIDVKSVITRKLPIFRLKKKLMKAVLHIDIIETD